MSTTMQAYARQRRNTKPVFSEPDTVPSEDISLPESLCITVVELITYLPNSLRNYEPFMRLVQASLNHVKLACIVNFHRQLVKDALSNSCGTIIRQTMRDGTGDENWNISAHKKDYLYDRDWEDDDLTFTGVELNCLLYANPVTRASVTTDKIDFADLARKVNVHPSNSRGDGFMLTRCVQYAAANPDKEYAFPDGYRLLCRKLYDGRRLTAAHNDQASLKRWGQRNVVQNYGNHEIETFSIVMDSDSDADADSEADAFNHGNDGGAIELMEGESPYGTVATERNSFVPQSRRVTDDRGFTTSLTQARPVEEMTSSAFDLGQHSMGDPASSSEVRHDSLDEWDLEDAPGPPIIHGFNMLDYAVGNYHATPPAAEQNSFQSASQQNVPYPANRNWPNNVAGHDGFLPPVDEDAHYPMNGNEISHAQSLGGGISNDLGFFVTV